MEKTLLTCLLEAGYPKKDIFHHKSDLYIYVTPLTKSIVKNWYQENHLNQNWHCTKFKDNITGRMMYDCAFQYYIC